MKVRTRWYDRVLSGLSLGALLAATLYVLLAWKTLPEHPPSHFDFHGAVDYYLALCRETGEEPERAYKGSFNVRVSPELHRQAVIYAADHQISLNKFIERAMENTLRAQG